MSCRYCIEVVSNIPWQSNWRCFQKRCPGILTTRVWIWHQYNRMRDGYFSSSCSNFASIFGGGGKSIAISSPDSLKFTVELVQSSQCKRRAPVIEYALWEGPFSDFISPSWDPSLETTALSVFRFQAPGSNQKARPHTNCHGRVQCAASSSTIL